MMTIELQPFKRFAPLTQMLDEGLRKLQRHAKIQKYKRGESLFELGATDEDSLFLLEGKVELTDQEGVQWTLSHEDDAARYPLANLKPRRYKGRVVSEQATLIRVRTRLLEKLLQGGSDTDTSVPESAAQTMIDEASGTVWLETMMRLPLFRRLSADSLEALVSRAERFEVQKGDRVIRQGKTGDYYYMIQQGKAVVYRRNGDTRITLAHLRAGDCFGEEALISGEPRNATVRMRTDGVLLRLSLADFRSLLHSSAIWHVDPAQAARMADTGAVRVDVREEEAFARNGLEGAINIPWYLMRLRAKQLEKDRRYILYCEDGKHSETAAFLLNGKGFEVYVMDGGLKAYQS